MQKYNFDAFFCRHFNFKIVLQSAPEHAIFIQKIDKFSSTPSAPTAPRPLDPMAPAYTES